MKTKQDNELIDHTGVVYTKNKIELSLPIDPGVVYDQN